MRHAARILFLALAAGAAGLSCHHPVGPSLTVVIESERLQPTALSGNTAICCCAQTGQLRNTSSITVHVSLRLRATGLEGQDLGTVLGFVENVPSGATRPFQIAGIQEPCARVGKTERDVLVIGAYTQP
jgi:hypothetical protein